MAINRQQRQSVNIPGVGEIQLPTINPPDNITTPRQTLRESEFFDTSCFGSAFEGDWILGDWCIAAYQSWPTNYLYIVGTTYIEGTPSTNPVDVSVTDWAEWNPPTYCMNGWSDATGNCDAMAVIRYSEAFPNGLILGFNFVNSIAVGGQSAEGASLFIQHNQGDVYGMGYPNLPFYIDELLLYRASTGTYHRLTDESLDQFQNGAWDTLLEMNLQGIPPITGNVNDTPVYINDLHFGPPLEETISPRPLPQQETIADCRTDEDCRDGFICHAGKCVSPESAPIGRTTQDRQLPNELKFTQTATQNFNSLGNCLS